MGELEHRRYIGGVETAHRGGDRHGTRPCEYGLAADHLGENATAKKRPTSRKCGFIGKEKAEQAARPCEYTQRVVALPGLIWHASQRADGRGIATSLSILEREVMVIGEQRVQDRIVEKIFAIVPRLRVSDDHGRIGVVSGHV